MSQEIIKSLGNITRVRILACLGQSDKSVTDLIGTCNLSQSAVSQHLAYLRKARLITAVKEGKFQIYKVVDKRLSKLCKEVLELTSDLSESFI